MFIIVQKLHTKAWFKRSCPCRQTSKLQWWCFKGGPLFYESNESMSHESMSQGYFINKVGYYIFNHRLPVFNLA